MCCLRVSGFLTERTQQIHSLRASGVISSHFARAAESEMRAFRKSAGTVCTCRFHLRKHLKIANAVPRVAIADIAIFLPLNPSDRYHHVYFRTPSDPRY